MKKKITFFALGYAFLASAAVYAQAPRQDFEPGAGYAALGSSFAAGAGVPVQLGYCGRSDQNYANLIASALNLTLTDATCNGATTDNIRHTAQGDAPPQIGAVNADTALVTVTIGGNDINYTSSTFACSGKPAEEQCAANLDQAAITTAISQLPARLGATFDEIRARAPEAVIVLVTYPRVFPVDAASCSELQLSPADTAYLADMGQQLEDIFVSVAASHQVLIADSYVLAAGHGPCDTASERWVNGATIASTGIRYHPTAEGHIEMARLVLAALGYGE